MAGLSGCFDHRLGRMRAAFHRFTIAAQRSRSAVLVLAVLAATPSVRVANAVCRPWSRLLFAHPLQGGSYARFLPELAEMSFGPV
jgi:hypothetical protein